MTINQEIVLTIIILVTVTLLFLSGRVRLDLVPVLVPPALIVFRLVSPEEAFAGFGSSAVVTVAALFVLTAGLIRTGVVNRAAYYLKKITAGSHLRLLLASTAIPGIFAGFIIVTATFFFFAPTVLRLALFNRVSRTRILLPMAAACLLGANLTLIGASHNLVVNSMLAKSTGAGFSFFELMPVGAVLLGAALLYSLLLGPRLLPGGNEPAEQSETETADHLPRTYELHDRLWELWVEPGSAAVGKTLKEAGLGERYGLSVIAVVRAEDRLPALPKDLRLQPEDVLLVLGREEKVAAFSRQEGLLLVGRPRDQKAYPLSTAELVELVVPPRSPVIGKTLVELNFREKTGLSVIALWHKGRPLRTDVGHHPLQAGDGLLLFGDRKKTRSFKPGKSFRWLHPPQQEEAPLELRPLGPYALLVLALVVVSAAFAWLPLSLAAFCGAAGMVIMKILTPGQAYESIEWRTIILIGCLFPLGTALEKSGASSLLAGLLVSSLEGFGPGGVLLGVSFLTILLTQPLHNVAAAIIMTPVALEAAQSLGANPKTFAVAVIIGASAAFLLPAGHPVSLQAQQLAGYTLRDYLRFGLGLCLLVLLATVFVVPFYWSF